MNTYVVITAEVRGSLKTGLILKEESEPEIDAAGFFPHDAKDVTTHGEVTTEGPGADMLPDWLVEG